MENINSIFSKRNIFVSYPSSYEQKQKSFSSLTGKELFSSQANSDINKEISMYLDLLYKDTDEELLKPTDKLKLNNVYLPIKCQTLNTDGFYL